MTFIPESAFNSTVILGEPQPDGQQPHWIGTGSLLRFHVDDQVRHYLVTAKHVVEKFPALYAIAPGNVGIAIPLRNAQGAALWRSPVQQDIDIAVVPVPANVQHHVVDEFDLVTGLATTAWLAANNRREGTEAFAIGPLTGVLNNKPNCIIPDTKIARRTTISHIRETLAHPTRKIILDGLAWNGWSGAPVVALEETEAGPVARLMAVVASYIPYSDVLQSPVTSAQVFLQYNSGLITAYAIDNALDAIGLF
ncbi:hypothetical protein BH11PLA2_BH11PLA2_29820 [soil metagenome]